MKHKINKLVFVWSVCVLFTFILGAKVFALEESEYMPATNELSSLWVIEDQYEIPSMYHLQNNISRQEMLKIMINISFIKLENTCVWKFSDLGASDWGCKYAETALANGYIAENKNFRPNDAVSKAEALKMIFQARGLTPNDSSADWRTKYVNFWVEKGILDTPFTDYNTPAKRGWIFNLSVLAGHATPTTENKCLDKFNKLPEITSLSMTQWPVGSKVEIFWCNFSGFEWDKVAWIENADGTKGILYGEEGSSYDHMTVTLKSPLCQEDNSYSGLECEKFLVLTPWKYQIFTNPWDKMSNKVDFNITEKNVSKLSESQAKKIAEATCIKWWEALGTGIYNENSKTWWFDANLNSTKPWCSPACVVSEETQKAEINWRCTGVIPTE